MSELSPEELKALSRQIGEDWKKSKAYARDLTAAVFKDVDRTIADAELALAQLDPDREIRHLIDRRVRPTADDSNAELARWVRETVELARYETLEIGVRLDTKSREKAEAAVRGMQKKR